MKKNMYALEKTLITENEKDETKTKLTRSIKNRKKNKK